MTFQAVADVDEVTADRPLAVDIDDELAIAIVLHRGEYFAITDECSHGKVPLSEGEVADGTIECYLHGSVFSLLTGRPLCLPATEPVRVFPCRVEGNAIEVDIDNPINPAQITQES